MRYALALLFVSQLAYANSSLLRSAALADVD